MGDLIRSGWLQLLKIKADDLAAAVNRHFRSDVAGLCGDSNTMNGVSEVRVVLQNSGVSGRE